VKEHDLVRPAADRTRRLDVWQAADRHVRTLAPAVRTRESNRSRPRDCHVLQADAETGDEHEREKDPRERQHHVGERLDDEVRPPAIEAGYGANGSPTPMPINAAITPSSIE
jgi:hypothetical protein